MNTAGFAMKKFFFAFAPMSLLAFMLCGCADTPPSIKKDRAILSVDQLTSDPPLSENSVIVTGVVARVSRKDKKSFSIIDTGEVMKCRSTGCAAFYLPVQFEGPTPKEWDEVEIKGRFVGNKGLMLEAESCDVLSHISVP